MWKEDLLVENTFNPCQFSLDSTFKRGGGGRKQWFPPSLKQPTRRREKIPTANKLSCPFCPALVTPTPSPNS